MKKTEEQINQFLENQFQIMDRLCESSEERMDLRRKRPIWFSFAKKILAKLDNDPVRLASFFQECESDFQMSKPEEFLQITSYEQYCEAILGHIQEALDVTFTEEEKEFQMEFQLHTQRYTQLMVEHMLTLTTQTA